MPSPMSIEIARNVLMKARMIDPRIQIGSTEDEVAARIAAWADVFDGQPVWPTEALEAVAEHYRKRNAFPIMPGDVLAYCAEQPATSSPEHVLWIFEKHVQHPWSTTIQELVGREIPELNPETYETWDKQFLIEKRREWLTANGSALVAEAIEKAELKALEG